MLSAQTIRSGIEELKQITGIALRVMDAQGVTIAATEGSQVPPEEWLRLFAESDLEWEARDEYALFKLAEGETLLYLLCAEGGEHKTAVGRIALSELRQLLLATAQRPDKETFLRNLIQGRIQTPELYRQAQKLHIAEKGGKGVLLIETVSETAQIRELLKGLFPERFGNYLLETDERNLALIRSLGGGDRNAELKDTADMIVDMVNTEAMANVRVACGMAVDGLQGLPLSFDTARQASEIGRIFYAEKAVISYHALGIGRLIHRLPKDICRIFVREALGSDTLPEEIDEEILATVRKLLENNLNISETARQLYVHRNTLVYRIEKLQKATGLDMRNFEDALTFRVALLVLNYLKYQEDSDP